MTSMGAGHTVGSTHIHDHERTNHSLFRATRTTLRMLPKGLPHALIAMFERGSMYIVQEPEYN